MEKRVIVKAEGLRKTFKLSKKQQTIQKTKDKVKVAVDCLDFEAYEGEILNEPSTNMPTGRYLPNAWVVARKTTEKTESTDKAD